MNEFLKSIPETNSQTRYASLCSRFPPKTVNPTSYNDKLSFWVKILRDACSRGLLYNSTGVNNTTQSSRSAKNSGSDQMVEKGNANGSRVMIEWKEVDALFTYYNVRPVGLDTVLEEQLNSREYVTLTTFNSDPSWSNWIYKSISSVSSIPYNLIFSSTKPASDSHIIVVSLLNELEKSLLSLFPTSLSSADAIMSIRELKTRIAASRIDPISDIDLELVLKVWVRNGSIAIKKDGIKVIKFLKPREMSVVTEIEYGIVVIKETLHKLNAQVNDLESEISKITTDAKQRIAQGQKHRAKYLLQKRHKVTQILENRLNSILTIENILDKIYGAETEAKILEAYNTGSQTLKSLLPSLQSVDSTMDSLQDALADAHEIESAIASGVQGVQNVDEFEIEQELEALVREEERKAGAKRKVENNELIQELEGLSVASGKVGEERAGKQKVVA